MKITGSFKSGGPPEPYASIGQSESKRGEGHTLKNTIRSEIVMCIGRGDKSATAGVCGGRDGFCCGCRCRCCGTAFLLISLRGR